MSYTRSLFLIATLIFISAISSNASADAEDFNLDYDNPASGEASVDPEQTIEMSVQIQNKNLLESMEIRARAQLRLQETVESLSIVAITYYVVGLISVLVNPLNFKHVFFNKEIFLAFCVPIILIFVWYIAKMVRKKINKIT